MKNKFLIKTCLEKKDESYENFDAVSYDFMKIHKILNEGYKWNKLEDTLQTTLIMIAMELSKTINIGLQKDSLLEIQRCIELILKNSINIKDERI